MRPTRRSRPRLEMMAAGSRPHLAPAASCRRRRGRSRVSRRRSSRPRNAQALARSSSRPMSGVGAIGKLVGPTCLPCCSNPECAPDRPAIENASNCIRVQIERLRQEGNGFTLRPRPLAALQRTDRLAAKRCTLGQFLLGQPGESGDVPGANRRRLARRRHPFPCRSPGSCSHAIGSRAVDGARVHDNTSSLTQPPRTSTEPQPSCFTVNARRLVPLDLPPESCSSLPHFADRAPSRAHGCPHCPW